MITTFCYYPIFISYKNKCHIFRNTIERGMYNNGLLHQLRP